MPDPELPSFDCYQVLGVPLRATRVEIEAAFRAAAMREHPDVSPDATQATLRMQRLNIARDWLTDAARRERYDAARGEPPLNGVRVDVTGIDPLGPWPTTYEASDRRGSQTGPIMASMAAMVLISMLFIGSDSLVAVAIAVASIVVLVFGSVLTILGSGR